MCKGQDKTPREEMTKWRRKGRRRLERKPQGKESTRVFYIFNVFSAMSYEERIDFFNFRSYSPIPFVPFHHAVA